MSQKNWPAMGCGVGLRNKHYPFILSEWPAMDWFEAVTENFMDTGGRPLRVLEDIRKHYPVALHGVSLSIGTADPPDEDYLGKLKALADRIDPFVVSDHLCWTGVDGKNVHDLLPLPFTEEALDHVVRRTQHVQEVLKRPILLENISTYVTYKHSAVPEWEFLREVARRSGCGILLDLNNIFVNSVNHRFDPEEYLKAIPGKWVGQFHLAGHTDKGPFLFDTHSAAIVEGVWKLYRKALQLYGPVSTLIEWDEMIPDFPRLTEEVMKAKAIYEAVNGNAGSLTDDRADQAVVFGQGKSLFSLHAVQTQMKDRILSHNHAPFKQPLLDPQGGSSGEERMAVYAEGYVARITEALAEVYETIQHLLGKEAFLDLSERYIDANPSHSYNLNFIGREMPGFISSSPYIQKLPFLKDLAELEWQVAQSFHATESPVFDPKALVAASEEDWEKMNILFQSSVSTVCSEWPILDIWSARKTPLKEIAVDLVGRPQCVLVARKGLEVVCELIEPAQMELIRALQSGESLGEACAQLAEGSESKEPPIGDWFASWALKGFIREVVSKPKARV